MDIKRTLLYIAMAMVVGLLWIKWKHEYPTIPSTVATTAAEVQDNQVTSSSSSTQSSEFVPSADIGKSKSSTKHVNSSHATTTDKQLITVNTDVLTVSIDPTSGNLVDALLPKYPVSLKEPNTPVQILNNTPGSLFQMQSGVVAGTSKQPLTFHASQQHYALQENNDQLTVHLTATQGQMNVEKTYVFARGKYNASLTTTLTNTGASKSSGQFYQQITRQNVPSSTQHIRSYDGASISSPKTPYEKVSFKKMDTTPVTQKVADGWVAMQQPYFITTWIPPKDKTLQYYSHVHTPKEGQANIYTIGYMSPAISLAPGKSVSDTSVLYIGPEIAKNLKPLANGLNLTVDYGWLSPISSVIFTVMSHIDDVIGNWGWSIILVTLLIKILFYWPSAQSYKSMAKMRAVQPRLNALKERFADDKAGLSKATMEFYKKEKVNPVGGCLPTLLQFPVFFALYYVIIESVQLRQAPFIFWIHDLSIKDPYYILPIIMGISMLLQQRLTPTPPDPTQAKMMMLMPIVFTFVFLSFPAGLVLYWITNNLLGIAQQTYVMKTYKPAKQRKKKRKR